MMQCPDCGCESLVKNGSTRGVPKWKGQSCGRQTSLRGRPAETDPEQQKKHVEAVLLDLSGLSLKAIAFLKSVVASTVLNWVRQCARQGAAKPKLGPEGVIVLERLERDEIWPFLGHKGKTLWMWLAFCRDTGQLVDGHGGARDQATVDPLLARLAAWKACLDCTDSYLCDDPALPVGRHVMGKEETWRLEQIHSRLRHGLARWTACGVA